MKAGLCSCLTNLAFWSSIFKYFSVDEAGPKPVNVLQSRWYCKGRLAWEKTEKAKPLITLDILEWRCDWPNSRMLSKLTNCRVMLFLSVSPMVGMSCRNDLNKPMVVSLMVSLFSDAGPKLNGSTM